MPLENDIDGARDPIEVAGGSGESGSSLLSLLYRKGHAGAPMRDGLQEPTWSVLLASGLVGLLLWAGGCVAIIPGIPAPVPGYGRSYAVVNEKDQAITSGFIYACSYYPATCKLGLFEIKDGKCHLPPAKEMRYSEEVAFLQLIDGIFLYRGSFCNADQTRFYPLVPGHIAVDKDGDAVVSGIVLTKDQPVPTTIRVRTAAPAEEGEQLRFIKQFSPDMTRKDKQVHGKLVEYLTRRLAELPPVDTGPRSEGAEVKAEKPQ